jgi:hypothetical protein
VTTIAHDAFPFLFATGFLMVGVAFYLSSRLVEALRVRHHEIWARLGKPTLFLNNSIQNSWALQRFIRSEELRTLNDPDLEKTAKRIRVIKAFYYVLLSLMMLSWLSQGSSKRMSCAVPSSAA